MACSKCGNTNIKPGQKFCTKCGSPLAQSSSTPSTGKPAPGADNQKGIIDNLTHFGTFIQRGSQGVQREIRREEEQRIRREAEQMGLEVNRPSRQQNQDGQSSNGQTPSRRLSVDNTSVEGVSIVQGRAIWNIQKGEIGRRITESEFANADGLKGIIVQEGCTALVFIDGQLITMMQAGVYTFPTKTEAEKQLEAQQKQLEAERKALANRERQLEEEQRKKDEEEAKSFRSRGVFGTLAAFGRGVSNFLFGEKKGETPQQHKQRIDRTVTKLKAVPMPKICRVYIVSNKIINIIFNSVEDASGTVEFKPMVIPTKLVDINVGVSMQLQVSNMLEFVRNYLNDVNVVTNLGIEQMLLPGVQNTLTTLLRNLDYQADGLPEPVVENLKNRIKNTCNERLHGIEVLKVLDITDKSNDFDRFRSVERELFATEKELGYLQRTGEFRNRLEQEQNVQLINHATNEEALRKALQDINKDKILSEDEMEHFMLLIESQKRLREAKTREQEYEALNGLRKSKLVSDDDLAALQNQLEQGKIDREKVTELMRIQANQQLDIARQIAEFTLSDKAMEHEMANELRKAQHQGTITQVELETQRLRDQYADERRKIDDDYDFNRRRRDDDYDFLKQQREDDRDFTRMQREQAMREQQMQADHSRQRQDKFDDMDILERKAAVAMRNMQAMKEAELASQNSRQDFELQKNAQDKATENLRIQTEATMTQEQIAAAHMKDIANLDAAAQKAAMEMMGSGNSVKSEMLEQQKAEQQAMYERMMKMQLENQAAQQQNSNMSQQQMMQMMQMMMSGMTQMGQNNLNMQQQQFLQQQQMQQQRYEDMHQLKDEYRENMMHQQQRLDSNVQQAMDYTTRSHQTDSQSFAQAMGGMPQGFQPQQAAPHQQPQQPQQQYQQPYQEVQPQLPQGKHCPSCGSEVPDDEMFCPECGQKL